MNRKQDDIVVSEHPPDLLTQAEAIELLRLDQLGLKDPKETLRYLRRTRRIGYVKVAGKVLIPRQEVLAYLERQTVPAMEWPPSFLPRLTPSRASAPMTDRGDPEPRERR
jgi:hypothetical protein